MNTEVDFVRILDNQPLTLACSALADFLWDDFIRDAKPTVKYLVDAYNIRQLSRFGKELFDRLYNADNVKWLVSEEAYEDYFRKICDGDTTAIPEGYKPENGIWYSIMNDLTQSAAWFELLKRSVGDQFNAGNNAVNILNELSKVIEDSILDESFDVELLTNSAQALQALREEYKKAQANGDSSAATEARRKGKELVNAINEAIKNAKENLQVHSHRIVDSTVKQSDSIQDAISSLWGSTQGTKEKKLDLEQKKTLAKKLESNKSLKSLVKKLGALRRIWEERKKARKIRSNYESISGAIFSDDVTKTFPAELALAGSEEGKALFALKYTQKSLLTKDFKAHRKDVGKGPIILYVDASGSMGGESELWSKAITFVVAEHAMKENRDIEIHLFDTKIDMSVSLDKSRKNNSELLDFVACWTLGGGTSFNAVIAHALDHARIEPNADVLLITDGNAEIHDNFVKRLNVYKREHGLQWSTICINSAVPLVCTKISDEVFSVNLSNPEATVEAVQKSIR
jgi:uncharacterized protein with von Willebrand factor type A (vWA) domain